MSRKVLTPEQLRKLTPNKARRAARELRTYEGDASFEVDLPACWPDEPTMPSLYDHASGYQYPPPMKRYRTPDIALEMLEWALARLEGLEIIQREIPPDRTVLGMPPEGTPSPVEVDAAVVKIHTWVTSIPGATACEQAEGLSSALGLVCAEAKRREDRLQEAAVKLRRIYMAMGAQVEVASVAKFTREFEETYRGHRYIVESRNSSAGVTHRRWSGVWSGVANSRGLHSYGEERDDDNQGREVWSIDECAADARQAIVRKLNDEASR